MTTVRRQHVLSNSEAARRAAPRLADAFSPEAPARQMQVANVAKTDLQVTLWWNDWEQAPSGTRAARMKWD